MKIGNMSIIVGNMYCNARCPFCISKVTMPCGVELIKTKEQVNNVNWRNFDKCCNLAIKSGVTTAFLTGKGEPTLFPELITEYLRRLNNRFPFVDLQTNAILASGDSIDGYLPVWYDQGLSTICISTVHWDDMQSYKIYQPYATVDNMRRLLPTIEKLHKIGYSVRLTVMLLKEYIDDAYKLEVLIKYCRDNKIEQLTVRPITTTSSDNEFSEWTKNHSLTQEKAEDMERFLRVFGNKTLQLPHGDTVYDFRGQNVCWGSCITNSENMDNIRQVIFYPDGKIRYDWKYEGSILL